jgi:hypothetical protein
VANDAVSCLDALAAEVVRLGQALEEADARHDKLKARLLRLEADKRSLRVNRIVTERLFNRAVRTIAVATSTKPVVAPIIRGRNFDSRGLLQRLGASRRRLAS